MILTWQTQTNIENSIIDFIRTGVINDDLQLLDTNGNPKTVNVYAGRELNNKWNLPLVQVYFDSNQDLSRLEIGSNKRLKSWLIIIDVRTLLPGQETNLASWIEELINDGVPIYNYEPNSSDTNTPAKVCLGYGRIDFITSTLVPSFDDADKFEQNRYRLSVKVWVNTL